MVTRKKFIDFPRSNKITGVNPYLFLLMFYDWQFADIPDMISIANNYSRHAVMQSSAAVESWQLAAAADQQPADLCSVSLVAAAAVPGEFLPRHPAVAQVIRYW